jgi:hypothetical protein
VAVGGRVKGAGIEGLHDHGHGAMGILRHFGGAAASSRYAASGPAGADTKTSEKRLCTSIGLG